MKQIIRVLILIAMALVIVVVASNALKHERPQPRAQLVGLAPPATGFARAQGPQPINFPDDFGPHPDYQTEWWYYTGNVQTGEGRHFGYQLTFFRRALTPPAQRKERASNWATDQVYMAHLALTDVAGQRHHAFERFARGAAGLAGAQANPYSVWLEDWQVEKVDTDIFRLRAAQGDIAIDLLLKDQKGPVLQGERGYSQKGPDPGNASYYFSQTRLATSGTVQVGNASYQVNGYSWMDHEFSTNALSPGQVGWDWFALQLDDNSELMVFQIRRADGSLDPFSSGTLILVDGSTRRLSHDDFEIITGVTWRSPRSGATYPAEWTISVPSANLVLNIAPYLADQELNVSYAYWEGAVKISGERDGRAVSGSGYIEMSGYAGSMGGQF